VTHGRRHVEGKVHFLSARPVTPQYARSQRQTSILPAHDWLSNGFRRLHR
jgi:hypothetical protein